MVRLANRIYDHRCRVDAQFSEFDDRVKSFTLNKPCSMHWNVSGCMAVFIEFNSLREVSLAFKAVGEV